jgi:sulfur transfer complex TusBCD TusB component (DsrH family)
LSTFVISALSLLFIEQPFRGKKPLIADRKKLFTLSAIVMFIASSIGSFIYFNNGMPYRSDANIALLRATNTTFNEGQDAVSLSANNEKLVGATDNPPSFIIWGDSHADAILPAISINAKKNLLSGFVATGGGCPPLLGVSRIPTPSIHINLMMINNGVIELLKKHPEIKTVFLVSCWAGYTGLQDMGDRGNSKQTDLDIVRIGVTRTVNLLLRMNRRVVIVRDVPNIGFDVSRDYYFSKLSHNYKSIPIPTLQKHNNSTHSFNEILTALADIPGVTLLSPDVLFFDNNGNGKILYNNKLLYSDSNHLSKYGAEYVSPVFIDIFSKMANGR